MNRTLILTIISTGLSLPAFAGTETAPTPDSKERKDVKQMVYVETSDAGFYVLAEGGVNFDTWYGDRLQTVDVPVPGGGTHTISSKVPINDGWGGVGGVKVGYNFESFDTGTALRLQPAVELEGLYIGSDATASDAFNTPSSEKFSTNSAGVFLNGILRFKNPSIVTPYLGLGVGLEYFTTHGDYQDAVALFNNFNLPAGTHVHATGMDTSDLDFAGQALIGFDVKVTSHISLFTEYKFIDAIGNDGKNAQFLNGDTYRFKPDQIQQNLVTAGITYAF